MIKRFEDAINKVWYKALSKTRIKIIIKLQKTYGENIKTDDAASTIT